MLHRLEMVKRAAARVVFGLRRRDHHIMTAAVQRLHWLQIAYAHGKFLPAIYSEIVPVTRDCSRETSDHPALTNRAVSSRSMAM